MSNPTVGDTAPDFTLAGTNGAFHLADHRGQTVVLVFYPGDDTKVCTKQLCEYTDRWDDLSGLDATIVGISGKDLASKEKFAEKRALKVPLLADPDRAVLGTKRSTFVIDGEGVIRFRHDATLGLTYLSADELRAAIAAI
jgi:peroxiredoxin Q/BCP